MSQTLTPGLLAVRAAAERLGLHLPALVAEVALWVPLDVQRRHVSPENPSGAVYPQVRRARQGSGERPGSVVDGVRLDRNTYANSAIREALGGRGKALAGYQACHVWPKTCYDARYHTALANLALVPSPLVSLTDHDPDVIAAMKVRAFELYGWHPSAEPQPERLPGYPSNWREPSLPAREPRRRVLTGRATEAPAARVDGEGQRVVMQRLWRRYSGDKDKVLRAAADALKSGEMRWRSNTRDQSAEEYAYRLWLDGTKKGWLP